MRIRELKVSDINWWKEGRCARSGHHDLSRAPCISIPRDRLSAALPTLVSDTSRGESRACLFCQWNNDNVIARGRFGTAPLPRGRRLDADMLIWRPFRDIKFSVYRFSPDEPRLDVLTPPSTIVPSISGCAFSSDGFWGKDVSHRRALV